MFPSGDTRNNNQKPSVQDRACEVQRLRVIIFGIARRKQLLYGLLPYEQGMVMIPNV